MQRRALATLALLMFVLIGVGKVEGQESADVIVKINNGYDALNAGQYNRVEFWFADCEALSDFLLGFSFQCPDSWFEFDDTYGNLPGGFGGQYVLNHHPSSFDPVCTKLTFASELVDSIGISPESCDSPYPILSDTMLAFSMLVFVPDSAGPASTEFCINNENFRDGGWAMKYLTGSYFPPRFQGVPNTSILIPDAPAVCFPVILAGDANDDGTTSIADAVFIVQYIFAGGPAPSLQQRADCNCDRAVTIADAVVLVNYIFGGGPEPGSLWDQQ